MKNKGPKILPCGMPQTTGLISDLVCEFEQIVDDRMGPLMPSLYNLENN